MAVMDQGLHAVLLETSDVISLPQNSSSLSHTAP